MVYCLIVIHCLNITDLIIKERLTNRFFHEGRRTNLFSEPTHPLRKGATQKKLM